MEEGDTNDCKLTRNDRDLWYQPCNVTESDKDLIIGISFGFGIVSLIGVLAIIGHAVTKRLYFTSEVRPIVHLSVANSWFCIFLIILSTLYLFASEKDIPKVTICVVTLEEIFYLVSFYLTANYTTVVYVRLRNKLKLAEEPHTLETQKTTRKMLRLSYQLSWILPPLLLVPITVTVLVGEMNIQLCSLCPSVIYYPRDMNDNTGFDNDFLKNYGFILVIASYSIVVIMILVIFMLSWRICSKLLKRKDIDVCDDKTIRCLRMRMSLHIVAFIYCWTPTFVIAILVLGDVGYKLPHCAPLFYTWAVTAPSHGLILAIIYFCSIFYQTSQSQTRRVRRPFGSRIYRFYGTGSQRSRWPKVRTPSASVSEGSQAGDTSANIGTLSPSLVSPSGNKKNQRSPSFLGLLKNQENEPTDGNGE